MNADSIPQSLLRANVTQALIDKIQYFESNANRTQICQDVNGYARAEFKRNLKPLMTLVPIRNGDDSLNSTSCSLPKPPTPKPKFPLITGIINVIRGLLSRLFSR